MAKKTTKKTAKKKAVKRIASAKNTPERRTDFGKPVMTYFESLEPEQRKTAIAAHKMLLKHAPDLQHQVKWGIAQYLYPDGRMKDAEGFAIYATSKSVNLAVGAGGDLSKKHPLLEGTGKSMRHVKLYSVKDATSDAVGAVVKDAVAMVRG